MHRLRGLFIYLWTLDTVQNFYGLLPVKTLELESFDAL